MKDRIAVPAIVALIVVALCPGASADLRLAPETGAPSRTISATSFSADGKMVATCGGEQITLWNSENGREIRTISERGIRQSDCVFSPDGKMMAAWESAPYPDSAEALLGIRTDKGIRLWDISTGRLLRTLLGHDGGAYVARFSPDGKTIATGGVDKAIRLWDAATGTQVRALEGYAAGVDFLQFSPSGRVLAGGDGKSVILWDTKTAKSVRTLAKDGAFALASGPAGSRIAIVTTDTAISDIETGKEVGRIPGVVDRALPWTWKALRLSRNGTRFARYSEDTVTVWDVDSGKVLCTVEHPDPSGVSATDTRSRISLDISPDGGRLLSGNSWYSIKVWDIATGKEVLAFQGNSEGAAFTPDGERIASADWEGGYVTFWEADTGRIVEASHAFPLTHAVFNQGGNRLASADCRYVVFTDGEAKGWSLPTYSRTAATVRIWDAQSVRSLPPQDDVILSLGFSPDGDTLVSGTGRWPGSFVFRLWDIRTATQRLTLKEAPVITAYARIGVANSDDSISAWDAKTAGAVSLIHYGKAYYVRFSPDRQFTATWGDANTVKIWKVENGERLWVLEGTSNILWVSFSADSKALAGTDGENIIFWSVVTGQKTGEIEAATNIPLLAFHPDGRQLAAVGGDDAQDILLWDIASKTQIRALTGHTARINALDFGPDGRILSGSTDKTMKLWDTQTGACLATLASFGGGGWVIAGSDGRFDGDLKGLQHLHWLEDGQVQPLDKYSKKYRHAGLLATFLEKR